MATLFRRSNGIYYLVTDVNGRRVWKSTKCKTSAEALKHLAVATRKAKVNPTIDLRQFATQIMATLQSNLAPTTVALYRSAFKKLLELRREFSNDGIFTAAGRTIQADEVQRGVPSQGQHRFPRVESCIQHCD